MGNEVTYQSPSHGSQTNPSSSPLEAHGTTTSIQSGILSSDVSHQTDSIAISSNMNHKHKDAEYNETKNDENSTGTMSSNVDKIVNDMKTDVAVGISHVTPTNTDLLDNPTKFSIDGIEFAESDENDDNLSVLTDSSYQRYTI